MRKHELLVLETFRKQYKVDSVMKLAKVIGEEDKTEAQKLKEKLCRNFTVDLGKTATAAMDDFIKSRRKQTR